MKIQNQHRGVFGVVFGLVVCLLAANELAAVAQRTTTSKRAAQRPAAKPRSLDSEAMAAAYKLFNGFFTKCGESYFHYECGNCPDVYLQAGGSCNDTCVNERITEVLAKPDALQLVETRGLRVEMRPKVLTTADKLNGFEWSGEIYFRFEAVRTSRSKGWRECCRDTGSFIVSVNKKQGQGWDASVGGLIWIGFFFARQDETVPYRKAKCEDAPASNY